MSADPLDDQTLQVLRDRADGIVPATRMSPGYGNPELDALVTLKRRGFIDATEIEQPNFHSISDVRVSQAGVDYLLANSPGLEEEMRNLSDGQLEDEASLGGPTRIRYIFARRILDERTSERTNREQIERQSERDQAERHQLESSSLSREANAISKESNSIATDANRISHRSMLSAAVATLIALVALVASLRPSHDDQLQSRFDSLEQKLHALEQRAGVQSQQLPTKQPTTPVPQLSPNSTAPSGGPDNTTPTKPTPSGLPAPAKTP